MSLVPHPTSLKHELELLCVVVNLIHLEWNMLIIFFSVLYSIFSWSPGSYHASAMLLLVFRNMPERRFHWTLIYFPAILVKRIFCSSWSKSHVRFRFERAELLLGTACLKHVKPSAAVRLITVGSQSEMGEPHVLQALVYFLRLLNFGGKIVYFQVT